MILIAFIRCQSNEVNNICTRIRELCNEIRLCLLLQGVKATWRELVLAFFNTVKAIESKKNVARKPELEFYIRFFVERQIHTLIDEHLPRFSDDNRVLLIYHNNNCVLRVLEDILRVAKCIYVQEPNRSHQEQFYTDYLKIKMGEDKARTLDSTEYSKIVLGIIGCGNLLIKD